MPTVVRKSNGRLIIRSRSKRGFNTHQVRPGGEPVLRDKIGEHGGSLHRLRIDRDAFLELLRGGHLYTKRSKKSSETRNPRHATSPPDSNGEPSTHVRHPVADGRSEVKCQRSTGPSPAAIVDITCAGCRILIPGGASYCPRCGRASQRQSQQLGAANPIGRVMLAVLAAVAAVLVVGWLAS